MSEAESAVIYDDTPPAEDMTPQLTEVKIPEPEKAPEPVAEDKPEPFTAKQQEIFNAEIARKVAKQREAERKAQELEEKYQEMQRKVAEYEAPVRPDIPPPPDPYETDFAARVAERDAKIAQAARWDASQEVVRQQQLYQQQQIIAKQQEAQMEKVKTYSKQAETLGITEQELAVAGQSVAQFIPNTPEGNALALHILDDPSGPELTVYLSKSPLELDKLVHMNPLKAAAYLESVIKPAAKRPPPTLAPEPIEPLKGSGVPEKGRGPAGVEYF